MDDGRYTDLEVIGRGGFSVVYRARDTRFGRDVALKVLTLDLGSEEAKRRFRHECSAAGRVGTHPHVVTVYDADLTEDGAGYLAMELCLGSYADRLRTEGPLPVDEVLDLGICIAGALAWLHENGVLHRDVKPENVLVNEHGVAVLSDFGIASMNNATLTDSLRSLTPVHAPPEVIEHARFTEAGDLYSLASTLYALLAGRPPFSDEADEGLMRVLLRIVQDPVPPIGRDDVPPALEEVLRRAMAKDPADRPASAVEMENALREIAGRPKVDGARRARTSARRDRPGRRRLVAWVAGGLALALVAAGASALFLVDRSGPHTTTSCTPGRGPVKQSARPFRDGATIGYYTNPERTSAQVWVIEAGARLGLPREEATKLGLTEFEELQPSTVEAIGTHPSDGVVMRDTAGETFIIAGGAHFRVRDLGELNRIEHRAGVVTIPRQGLDDAGVIPRDGTLLRQLGSKTVWEVRGSVRRPVTDLCEDAYVFDLPSAPDELTEIPVATGQDAASGGTPSSAPQSP